MRSIIRAIRAFVIPATMFAGFLLALSFTAGSEASIMHKVDKALFANFMVCFATPECSGYWQGWNYSNEKVQHDPEKSDAQGRRDIASCYYPTIGTYDMTDPEVAEYHCQLMKMTGIDGAVFTLGFFKDPNSNNPKYYYYHQRVIDNYFKYLKAYQLKGMLLFEDKANWLWNPKVKTRQETVWAAFHDLDRWLERFEEVQYTIGGRPLFFIFRYNQEIPGKGQSCFSPGELAQWKEGFTPETSPVIASQWFGAEYKGMIDGYYEWPYITGQPPSDLVCRAYNDFKKEVEIWESRHEEVYLNLASGNYAFIAGGVWPGFEDTACHGWGGGIRIIPRYDGKVYAYHWQRMIASNYPLVQVGTWNDWFEGTVIEPTHEFGTQYLEITRKYVAEWRKMEYVPVNLQVPVWIFKMRKLSQTPRVQRMALQASEAIQAGEYNRAEELVKPFVGKMKLDQKLY